jgi:four helix bundle protein
MSTIKRFEDLEVWQTARKLNNEIFSFTQKVNFSKDFTLKDQIKRSSGSVMDNIAEGFAREGTKELISFLSISKGSAAEVQSQLYRALDFNYIDKIELDSAYDKSDHIQRMISKLSKYLQNSGIKGNKFIVKEDITTYNIKSKEKQKDLL